MKARVKATGEIVDVSRLGDKYIMTNHPHSIAFNRGELDFEITDEPDYWEKLKHQYAGMAMQGILANNDLMEYLSDRNKDVALSKIIVDNADIAAVALINKLKEDEMRDDTEGKALYAVDKVVERTKKEIINKACEWFEKYLFDIGYPDDWCRDSQNLTSGKERFIKAMEK